MGTEGGRGNIKQSVEHTMLQSYQKKLLVSQKHWQIYFLVFWNKLLRSKRKFADSKAAPSAFMGAAGGWCCCLAPHPACPVFFCGTWRSCQCGSGVSKIEMSHSQVLAILTEMIVCHSRYLGVFCPNPIWMVLWAPLDTRIKQKLDLWAKIVVKNQWNKSKFRSMRGEAVISEQELSNSDTFGKQWKRCTYKNRRQNTDPMWDNSALDQGAT